MRFIKFEIKNYKGIQHCVLDLDRGTPPVFALVGLNESGKTTLLEAINHFVAGDRELQRVYGVDTVKLNKSVFIPKNKQLNFNEDISIKALVELNASDIASLVAKFADKGYIYNPGVTKLRMWVTQFFKYKESNYVSSSRNWGPVTKVKKEGDTKAVIVDNKHPCWQVFHQTVAELMPQICYFPTFLFDVPDKIFIEEHTDEDPTNAYYRKLIQDILDSLGQGLTVKTHIVERIRGVDGNGTWGKFVDSDRREQVNHVLSSAAEKVTRVIIASWKRVFNVNFEGKRVEFEYGIDSETQLIAIKVFIIDPPERYRIRDRSLGFQWFFCFWLFTYFRTLRSQKTSVVFLLDEPASNLHARAQEEILKSLESLAEDGNVVIYSTHSHYLINPAWLDRATIVSNGLPLKGDIVDEFALKADLDITAKPYRAFVGSHPNQRTYYLPVLDALDYKPSELTLAYPSLIVEGKADFAFFKAAFKSEASLPFSIIPAGGATTMAPIISILTGWGLPVAVLLDDDKEGRDASASYIKSGVIEPDNVTTIGTLYGAAKGLSLEKMLVAEYEEAVKSHFSVDKADKSLVQKFLAETLASSSELPASKLAEELAAAALEWATKRLSS